MCNYNKTFNMLQDIDFPEIKDNWQEIYKRKQNEKEVYLSKELIDCYIIDYNLIRLKEILNMLAPFPFQPYTLYRIYANKEKGLIVIIFHKDITSVYHDHVKIPDIDDVLESVKSENLSSLNINTAIKNKSTILDLKIVNSAVHTVINNIIETYDKNDNFPIYNEIWYIKTRDKNIKSVCIVSSIFSDIVKKDDINSIQEDFERYLHQYIKPMSLFDIIGPAMVGPSSSHTAGANRIGRLARNIILAKEEFENHIIKSIEVKLLGSFRDTGPGHKTPLAIGGGLYGYDADHQQMLNYGDPDFLHKNGIPFNKSKAKFTGYIKGEVNEDFKYLKEHNNNITEIKVVTDKEVFVITGFSIGGGNIEIRYINERLETPVNGKTDFYLLNNKVVSHSVGKKDNSAIFVNGIDNNNIIKNKRYRMPFNSFEELEDYLNKSGIDIIKLILDVEYQLQGTSTAEIYQKLSDYWEIMQKAVINGITDSSLSQLGLTGKDSGLMNDYIKKNRLLYNLNSLAAVYATAVNEVNAKSGVIIACPTAGSCGILPGVLKAYTEFYPEIEIQKIYNSIMIAGFFGMILFNDVSTAGADYGCQAEIGVGAAMAAAALSYLEGGNINQIIHAFILCIKNSLGLICDPVAGLVEVPCVKRNGVYASMAVTSSMMALSNVKSFISPDEVVLTMKEVGNKLHRDYKETAKGGLAKTRDGKAVEKAFESVVNNFFK